jgi:hypothetical protein
MAERQTVEWPGRSGKNYTYYIYGRHPKIEPKQDGNYIYARINNKNEWVPVYIGQGDLGVRCTKSHHQVQCIDSKLATHVHLHLNKTEVARLAEERDLLANFPDAYDPSGCNVRKGG